jgi:hypothetical protein
MNLDARHWRLELGNNVAEKFAPLFSADPFVFCMCVERHGASVVSFKGNSISRSHPPFQVVRR